MPGTGTLSRLRGGLECVVAISELRGIVVTRRIAIVIPVRGRHRELAAVLAGLDRASETVTGAANIVIHIVFDHDEEGFLRYTDDPPRLRLPLMCSLLPAGGPCLTRNFGALHSDADVVAFLDSDVVPAPTYLAALVDHFSTHPDCQVVRGPVRAVPARPSRWHRAMVRGVFIANDGREWFYSSANLAWTRKAFLASGGFDPVIRMPSCEDLDLCWRWLLRDGGRIDFCPAMAVAHPTTKVSAFAALREFRRKRYDALLAARFPSRYARVYAYQWGQLAVVIGLICALWVLTPWNVWAALALVAGGLGYGFIRTQDREGYPRFMRKERLSGILVLPLLPLAYALNFIEGLLTLVALRPQHLFGRRGRWRRGSAAPLLPLGYAESARTWRPNEPSRSVYDVARSPQGFRGSGFGVQEEQCRPSRSSEPIPCARH